jgi:hypothetical protein
MVSPSSAASRFLILIVSQLLVVTTGPAEACCQLGGSACGDPFALSCNNGVVCFFPWKTCADCTCTMTNGGQTCLPTASEPGTVPTLLLNRSAQTSGDLDLSWGASCGASGPDYAIEEGELGVWFSHTPLSCSSGHALSMTITPSGGDRYYLIAPIAGDFTGSFGTTGAGLERPDAESSCTADRALAPCP